MKARSPIEMMVGKACGFNPESPEHLPIELYCPKCKKKKTVTRDKSDPVDAVKLELKCPECFEEGTFESLIYIDKSGKEIR